MNRKLYLECYSGISGDMTVAALLDLGADSDVCEKAVKSLPLQGFELKISRVKKSGIDACDFNVVLDEEHENHDHDMEYLHGHDHVETHEHKHDEHKHAHTHDTETGHEHKHAHTHRGMKEITEIIQQGNLTEGARTLALKIFGILAESEAKAHCVPVEQVHFHEVGAVDSIVDIVAAAVCLDNIGIHEVIITDMYEGKGTVRCQHGILPVPVPAVSNILQAYSLPVHFMERTGEFITPTGAAIAAAVRTSGKLPERFAIHKIGIGAGKRAYECPSMVRAMLIEEL